MKKIVVVFKTKYKCFSLKPPFIRTEYSCDLSDMAYGQFLIYNNMEPKFVVHFLDENVKEVSDFIENNNVFGYSFLKKLIEFNKLNLSLSPKCSNSISIEHPSYIGERFEIQVEKFPVVEYFNNITIQQKKEIVEKCKMT